MKKSEAIQLFGSKSATAAAIGISAQAVSDWPDELSPAIADRVVAARAKQLGLLPALIGAPAEGSAPILPPKHPETPPRDPVPQARAAEPRRKQQRRITPDRRDGNDRRAQNTEAPGNPA